MSICLQFKWQMRVMVYLCTFRWHFVVYRLLKGEGYTQDYSSMHWHCEKQLLESMCTFDLRRASLSDAKSVILLIFVYPLRSDVDYYIRSNGL